MPEEVLGSEIFNGRAGDARRPDELLHPVHGEGLAALDSALSYYNTGSPTAGLTNGYVRQVKTQANHSEHIP